MDALGRFQGKPPLLHPFHRLVQRGNHGRVINRFPPEDSQWPLSLPPAGFPDILAGHPLSASALGPAHALATADLEEQPKFLGKFIHLGSRFQEDQTGCPTCPGEVFILSPVGRQQPHQPTRKARTPSFQRGAHQGFQQFWLARPLCLDPAVLLLRPPPRQGREIRDSWAPRPGQPFGQPSASSFHRVLPGRWHLLPSPEF